MAITSGTIALIGAGIAAAGATGGAIGSSANRKKAREEEQRYYQSAMDYLNSMYYRDPLTTVGNRSLIKQVKKNYEDNLDALQNRAVAGGATMENALAARQANNENLDKVYTTLLQGEDARRDRISAQKMSLEGQHSQNIQNGFYQAAQDWQQWGGQMAQAGMSLMNAGLLGDAGGAAETAAATSAAEDPGAMGVAAKWLSKGDVTTPITAVGGIQTPNQIDPSLAAGNFTDKYLAKEGYYGQRAGQNLGGLRGIKYNDRGVPVIG